MLLVLYIVALLLIIQIKKKKLYKSSFAIFYWFLISTFVTPTLYYSFMDGTAYKIHTEYDYNIYILIGIIFLAFSIIINIIKLKSIKFKFISSIKLNGNTTNTIPYLFLIIIFIISTSYIYIYRNQFPIINFLLTGNMLSDVDRPDGSGSIPFYTSIYSLITIGISMLYFYFKEHCTLSYIQESLLFVFTFIILIAGGNKGLTMYFIIFIWMNIWKYRLDIKILSSIILMLCIYTIVKYGVLDFSDGILYLLDSPMRRFFTTQGAMFLARISFFNSGYIFTGERIATQIFEEVYGYEGGAPTMYAGDLIVRFGYLYGLLFSLLIFFVLFWISKNIDLRFNQLYIKWGIFYILFCLGNSEFNVAFLLRVSIVIFCLFILKINESKIKIQY